MARISIRNYTTSVLTQIVDDAARQPFAVDTGMALLILGLITALGVGLTVVFLKRADVA